MSSESHTITDLSFIKSWSENEISLSSFRFDVSDAFPVLPEGSGLWNERRLKQFFLGLKKSVASSLESDKGRFVMMGEGYFGLRGGAGGNG